MTIAPYAQLTVATDASYDPVRKILDAKKKMKKRK
jgi:hypothetical protein